MAKFELPEIKSAKALAGAYIAAKTKPQKDQVLACIREKADANKRVRWTRLLRDVEANDIVRVKARASGDWAAVNADRKAKPDAPAKPKAATKAKAAAVTPESIAQAVANFSPDQMAAFFAAINAKG